MPAVQGGATNTGTLPAEMPKPQPKLYFGCQNTRREIQNQLRVIQLVYQVRLSREIKLIKCTRKGRVVTVSFFEAVRKRQTVVHPIYRRVE